ncbi:MULTISPECIES: DUF3813 domain-containing protein [Pontibacillus]|nr:MULTISPECIES: DUF3813 domain-containing protein [Pontibacillus]GGD17936.1 hypothetical protein GCM10011389_27140 [Pontibacillus salipaludis]
MMQNNLFQQAKSAVNNITNRNGEAKEKNIQTAKNCINSARANASQEEQAQLQQLESEIERHQGLK